MDWVLVDVYAWRLSGLEDKLNATPTISTENSKQHTNLSYPLNSTPPSPLQSSSTYKLYPEYYSMANESHCAG